MGETGWTRLLGSDFNSQITWLALATLVGLIVALCVAGWKNRQDIRRAVAIIFGGWLIVTWLVFSFMSGIFHAYYTVALSPAIAILAAIAETLLWSRRKTSWAPFVGGFTTLTTSLWAYSLVSTASGYRALAIVITIMGAIATIIMVGFGIQHMVSVPRETSMSKFLAYLAVLLAATAMISGPVAWTAATVATGHQGSIVSAGPNSSSQPGGMGGAGVSPGLEGNGKATSNSVFPNA
ncbi:hypothetical protein ACFQY8_00420 [Alloscardovia venturai]|uniref:MHYT domain-containing protein n=1 Tax=Alloscardovia venturai TaxID=1769421 RepID=A0ABW2Y841_9BIFI